MKRWRRVNMSIGNEIRELLDFGYPKEDPEIKKLQAHRITHKEARTFFTPEQPVVSDLLWALMKVARIPTTGIRV